MPRSRWTSALVTGASAGIGQALARRLATDACDLVVVARRGDRLQALATELSGRHGVGVEVICADLATDDGCRRVEARLLQGEPVDLLVNNAGIGASGSFTRGDGQRQAAQVRVNVLALQRLTHAGLQPMVARGHGAVLNVSSVAGFQPLPYAASYAATKAFVTSFSEALHAELAPEGVTVTAACPGFTRTDFVAPRSGIPRWALLEADAVAAAALDGVRRGKAVVVPGPDYRLAVGLSRVAPGALRRRLLAAAWRRRERTSRG